MQTAEIVPERIPPHEVDRLRASIARESLADFTRFAWNLVEPTSALKWSWHLDVLCEALESVTSGSVSRLVINIPPGCSKSLMVSVFWPAWEWASDPSLRYFTASYSQDLTIRDNRRLRSIVTSDWYRKHFDAELASDQYAKVRFDTAAKGWRIASSVGGGGTGEHPDRIIIDDPLKAEEARSATARESVTGWFDGTVATRVASDRAAMVVIMQRLHEEDLSGHLLSRGGWEHICLPMEYEPGGGWDCECHADRPDPRDPRTSAGDLLWPDGLWSPEKVAMAKLDLGPYGTAGQLQQRPSPEGGGLFESGWFEVVDAAPQKAERCRGWDTAATVDGGDWTAGVRIARADGIFYVEDVFREQLSAHGVEKAMRQHAEWDGRSCAQREEQEPGASGKTVTASRARQLAGYNYGGVSVTGDKVTRAMPFRAQAEAGNAKLVRGPWNETYLRELSTFPSGKHDDQVDASSCAFNELALGPGPVRERTVVFG